MSCSYIMFQLRTWPSDLWWTIDTCFSVSVLWTQCMQHELIVNNLSMFKILALVHTTVFVCSMLLLWFMSPDRSVWAINIIKEYFLPFLSLQYYQVVHKSCIPTLHCTEWYSTLKPLLVSTDGESFKTTEVGTPGKSTWTPTWIQNTPCMH